MMEQAILNGFLLGGLLSVLVGPVFFLLIEVSLREGFRSALFLDIGIILSDGFCILIAYFGMAALLENPKNKLIFILIGSAVLIIMGVLKIIPPKEKPDDKDVKRVELKRSNGLWLALQGFLYNILNPSVIIFWITSVGAAVALYGDKRGLIGSQFATTLGTVFFVDILKAWFAKKMGPFIHPKVLRRANLIVGFVFVFFGLLLIFRAATGKL
jgi:threonine/homoserine/homoserine lactone efflux protein